MGNQAQWKQFSPQPQSWWWINLIGLHDLLFSDANKEKAKQLVIRISIAGFAVHLLLVLAANNLPAAHLLLPIVGRNYMAIIATPFNFILFYEVLTLIATLPSSTTRSIAHQYEIVSLVFIRDVFRDFGIAVEPDWISKHPKDGMPLLFDMCAALLMFLLVTLFQAIASRQVEMPMTARLADGRHRFMEQKKIVALVLTAILILLASYHLYRSASEGWSILHAGENPGGASSEFFYNDFFTAMVFTDVLTLILSLTVSGRYEMVFRNAAFVVSIILIRFSLTEERPYGAVVALSSMVFGILTLLLFNFHSYLRASDQLVQSNTRN